MTTPDSNGSEKIALDRRSVLGGGGLAATVAAIATVARGGKAEAMQATPKQKAGRYQDSAHVQRFYALNRR